MRLKFLLVAYVLVLVRSQDAQDTCFDGPFDNVGMDGCVGECADFETLEEAEEACLAVPECSGVTKATYGDKEAIEVGIGLFEIRHGPGLFQSVGDRTWIKQAWCKEPTSDSNFLVDKTLHIAENAKSEHHNVDEDSWDYDIEQDYHSYSKVMFNFLYVAGFFALAGLGVGIAYCSGDASTIAIVDGFREKIRGLLKRDGTRASASETSAYESL